MSARREAVYRLFDEVTVVEPTRAILGRSGERLPSPLGTLGAIHVSTALAWRDATGADLVFATHDAALATAARSMGFQTIGGGPRRRSTSRRRRIRGRPRLRGEAARGAGR